MLHPRTIVRPSKMGGIGVFASERIAQGTVVWGPCPCCAFTSGQSMRQLAAGERGWIEEFGYGLADDGMIVACQNGHLLNHSCEPGVLDYGLDFGVAVRDIAADEEITVDYRTFIDDPSWIINCACQTPSCIHEVYPRQGLDERVIAGWRQRLEPVLPLIGAVPQPCHSVFSSGSTFFKELCKDHRGFRWQDHISIRRPGFMLGRTASVNFR